jgi:hypothetical protein
MLVLPSFDLWAKQPDPPRLRAAIIVEAHIPNEHGTTIVYRVRHRRTHASETWWISAAIDSHRHSNTLRTTSATKAQQWIDAIQRGRIAVEDPLIGYARRQKEAWRARQRKGT